MSVALSPDTVCLVDDDPSMRQALACLLEAGEVHVRSFGEPEAFLTHIKANSVKLAILDIWMTPMTGMEVLAHLCARSPGTRVIFITGRDDDAARATVMQAGAYGFFVKPVDDDDFLNTVYQALGDAAPNNRHSTCLCSEGAWK